MAAVHYKLAIGAAAVRLSDVYGDGAGVAVASHDVPYQQVILQAETADIEVGGPTVTTSDYGVKLPSTAPAAPLVLGPCTGGPVKLSDLYAISTSATLHILAIPS
jgi:hypothetical protein